MQGRPPCVAEVARVDARFREKYGSGDGWADRMRALFGGKIAYRRMPIAPAEEARGASRTWLTHHSLPSR